MSIRIQAACGIAASMAWADSSRNATAYARATVFEENVQTVTPF